MALCPQFVDTPLVSNMMQRSPKVAAGMMGPLAKLPLLQPSRVVECAMQLTQPSVESGAVGLLLQTGRLLFPYRQSASKL